MRKTKLKISAVILAAVTVIGTIPVLGVSAAGIRGDANASGKTDVRDCAHIAKMLAMGKSSTLPETADYNRDGKCNVSDAANLARDVAAGNIKTYNSVPVIPGLEIGMTTDEVFAVIGTDYTYSYKSDIHVNENITYNYNIDSVDIFDVNIPSVMFVEFSDGILYNFGYHIGLTEESLEEYSYTSDINALTTAYDKIYGILTGYYGKSYGSDYYGYTSQGTIDEATWVNTDYGDVWMIVGQDLWMENSGVNEILISSCDQSLAGDYIY